MSILILVLVVLIICAMACWAVTLLPLQAPFRGLIQAVIILIGVLVIVQRSGLLA